MYQRVIVVQTVNKQFNSRAMIHSPGSPIVTRNARLIFLGNSRNISHGLTNPAQRILFGSHAPLFYFESALLQLKESPLSEEQLKAIRRTNAQRLFAKYP